MTTEAWVAIGSLATILGAYVAARVAGKSTVKAAKVSADENAFIRAKEIYESSISELRQDLSEQRSLLDGVAALLEKAREEIRTLRRSVSQYEGRVIQLQEVLRLHHIEVPPWTLMPYDGAILPGSLPDPNQPLPTLEEPDDAESGH
jgi:hypothetical protein